MIIDSLSLKDRIIWMIYHNEKKGISLSWDDFLKVLIENNKFSLIEKIEDLINKKYMTKERIEEGIIYKLTNEGRGYFESSIAKLKSLKDVRLDNPIKKVRLKLENIQRSPILNDEGLFTYNLTIKYSGINSIVKLKIYAKNKDQMINKVWKKLNIRCPLFYYNIKTDEIIEGKVYPTFLAKFNVKLGSGTYLFKKNKRRINKNP
jgi:hypothetical protein